MTDAQPKTRGNSLRQAPVRSGGHGENYRLAAFFLLLAVIWLMPASLQKSGSDGALQGGSIVTQIVWILLLAFSAAAMSGDWARLKFQIDLPLLAILLWSALTIPFALVPDVAARRYFLMLIALISTMICVSAPRNHRTLIWIIAGAAMIDILMKYGFALAIPSIGRHQAGEVESQLAGLWRGQYAHKNSAAPATVVQILALVSLRRNISIVYLAPIIALEVFFLIQSGSKSAIGFAVITLAVSFLVCRMRSIFAISLMIFIIIFVAHCLTLFTVMSYDLQDIARLLVDDVSYTGRTELWRFMLDRIHESPIMGVGFQSFWQIGFLSPAQQDGRSWLASAPYAHQGYLDLSASIGIPGLLLALWFVFIRPVGDISKVRNRRSTLLEFYVGVWFFSLLHNVTETSLFDRASLIWVATMIAIFGLRRLAVEERAVGTGRSVHPERS